MRHMARWLPRTVCIFNIEVRHDIYRTVSLQIEGVPALTEVLSSPGPPHASERCHYAPSTVTLDMNHSKAKDAFLQNIFGVGRDVLPQQQHPPPLHGVVLMHRTNVWCGRVFAQIASTHNHIDAYLYDGRNVSTVCSDEVAICWRWLVLSCDTLPCTRYM